MNDKIKILMTSDVHAYVYPYSYANGKAMDHGFGKVASQARRALCRVGESSLSCASGKKDQQSNPYLDKSDLKAFQRSAHHGSSVQAPAKA